MLRPLRLLRLLGRGEGIPKLLSRSAPPKKRHLKQRAQDSTLAAGHNQEEGWAYLASTAIADKHELEGGSLSSHFYCGCGGLMGGLMGGSK